MDKAEKALLEKLKKETEPSFTREENIILQRWDAHGFLNPKAFHDSTSVISDHKEYDRGRGHPFTALGDAELNKHWYLKFREGKTVTVLRDLATVFAFGMSVWLAFFADK
jgi:hypothetical protein